MTRMLPENCRPHAGLALALGIALVIFGAAPDARAKSKGPPCEKEDAKLAATGKGDTDQDGLSKCREKLLGTLAKEDDTDHDGLEDGEEYLDGTSPLDADSDDDGLDDGDEIDLGTDPHAADSDADGEDDGEDSDPAGELESKIESDVQALVCPSAGADGSLTLLGLSIVLTAETSYDDVASCEDLAEALIASGGAHVDVKVEQVGAAIVAHEVELEDGDHDGSPDDVDHDDDDDGGDHHGHGDSEDD